MNELTKQEHDYLLQVLLTRPLGESLPLYLKLTGQELVQLSSVPPRPPMPGPA